ncbi:membrane-bound lytic murein transglycosylase MltF [Veronia pacifica]|uniref:membrane-bound lytic murein transglycosylase MltF n=1 Tax=Veronia pacifica TaxID=1080227 RepID=UPI0009F28670
MFISLIAVLTGCQWDYDDRTQLEKIRDRGVLRVGTLNNQLSYYIDRDGPTGLDFELAQRFADSLGLQLEMQPAYTLSGLFPALERGDVDIIAAGLTVTRDRMDAFRAGPAYYFVSQQLVYKNGHWHPRKVKDLTKEGTSIAVVNSSSHELTLEDLQQTYPNLVWDSVTDTDDDELLKKVSDGSVDFTIADSVDIALIQRTHPNIAVALELSEDEPISWFMKKQTDDSVYALMIEFFGKIKKNGELAQLEEKYFGHVGNFDFVDTRAFLRAIEKKLPKWEPLFKKYAAEFDWRLLAALSYQESHWNPRAVSPTGVRGMMMLTKPTAKDVGVKNRLDPEQSIRGGATYLARMVRRIPDSVNENERIWFALASYNVGFGHLMDARRLTASQGANPDSWRDVKKRLPMLAERKYYSKTRYGFARGYETLNYVENIRRYYQSISGYEQSQLAEAEQPVSTGDLADLKTINVTPEEASSLPEVAAAAAAAKVKGEIKQADTKPTVKKASGASDTKKVAKADVEKQPKAPKKDKPTEKPKATAVTKDKASTATKTTVVKKSPKAESKAPTKAEKTTKPEAQPQKQQQNTGEVGDQLSQSLDMDVEANGNSEVAQAEPVIKKSDQKPTVRKSTAKGSSYSSAPPKSPLKNQQTKQNKAPPLPDR